MLKQLGEWIGIALVIALITAGVVFISYFTYDYNVGVEKDKARIISEGQAQAAQLRIEKLKFPLQTIACYDGTNRLTFAAQVYGAPSFHPNKDLKRSLPRANCPEDYAVTVRVLPKVKLLWYYPKYMLNHLSNIARVRRERIIQDIIE